MNEIFYATIRNLVEKFRTETLIDSRVNFVANGGYTENFKDYLIDAINGQNPQIFAANGNPGANFTVNDANNFIATVRIRHVYLNQPLAQGQPHTVEGIEECLNPEGFHIDIFLVEYISSIYDPQPPFVIYGFQRVTTIEQYLELYTSTNVAFEVLPQIIYGSGGKTVESHVILSHS